MDWLAHQLHTSELARLARDRRRNVWVYVVLPIIAAVLFAVALNILPIGG